MDTDKHRGESGLGKAIARSPKGKSVYETKAAHATFICVHLCLSVVSLLNRSGWAPLQWNFELTVPK
jgi:hypothetical protein